MTRKALIVAVAASMVVVGVGLGLAKVFGAETRVDLDSAAQLAGLSGSMLLGLVSGVVTGWVARRGTSVLDDFMREMVRHAQSRLRDQRA